MSSAALHASRLEAPRLFAWRSALLFCAPMLVNGIVLLYFPVFLEELKMSDIEIGIIVSLPFLVRIVGMPLGAFIADRVSDRSIVLIWSAVLSLVTTVALFFAHSFWPVALIYALQGVFYAPFMPIAEAVLITGVRRWGFDYGFLRLWGSVAFIVTTLAGGWLLDIFGGDMVLPSMGVFFLLTIAAAIGAPRLGRDRPRAAAPVTGAKRKSPFWRPVFMLAIIGASIVQGSHGMLFGFATNYWKLEGISGSQISLLWTAGVGAEILMFFVSGRTLARLDPWSMMLIGSVIAVLRWCLFPHLSGFWPFMLLQCSHAFTFAMIHIGIQRFMMEHVEDGEGAAAQSFYQTFVAVFNVLTAWASGYIFQIYGVDGFYSMAIVASVGVLTLLVAMAIQPQSAGSGG